MGLRDRLVNRVRSVLGKPAERPPASVPVASPVLPVAPTAPVAAPVAAPVPAPRTGSPAGPPGVTGAASVEDPSEKAAKVEKARSRARKGVLLHIDKQGGSMNMSDAHDFSERRFFIAHRGFSDMMGWWIEAGYVHYEEPVMHLTDSGRAFAQDP